MTKASVQLITEKEEKSEIYRKKTIGLKCLIGRSAPKRDAQEHKD